MLIITHNGEKVTLTHVLIHVCIRLVSMKNHKKSNTQRNSACAHIQNS